MFISCFIFLTYWKGFKKLSKQIYLHHHPNVSWLLRSIWFQWHGPSKTEASTFTGNIFRMWNVFEIPQPAEMHVEMLEEGPPCQSSGSHFFGIQMFLCTKTICHYIIHAFTISVSKLSLCMHLVILCRSCDILFVVEMLMSPHRRGNSLSPNKRLVWGHCARSDHCFFTHGPVIRRAEASFNVDMEKQNLSQKRIKGGIPFCSGSVCSTDWQQGKKENMFVLCCLAFLEMVFPNQNLPKMNQTTTEAVLFSWLWQACNFWVITSSHKGFFFQAMFPYWKK